MFVVRVFVVVVVVAKSRERKKGGAASRIVVESGGTKNIQNSLYEEKNQDDGVRFRRGGGGGRMLFPLAPGRAKDERNQSEILLRAISEPRKSASTEDEVTAETKTGSQRATTPSSSSKSSSSAGKKKTFVANNKKKKNSGKKTKGTRRRGTINRSNRRLRKSATPEGKKFAPLIAGVADDVPLNQLLKKYPNFEDCLGPKKYDSGHFIRLYSDLVRCDRLGDAIDLLQRLSDAKVPCLNDKARIRKYRTVDFLVSCERSNKLKNSPVMHAFTFTNLVLKPREMIYRQQKLRRYITNFWRCALRTETATAAKGVRANEARSERVNY